MFNFIDISHDRYRDYIIQRLQSKCLSLEKCYRDQVNRHSVRMMIAPDHSELETLQLESAHKASIGKILQERRIYCH